MSMKDYYTILGLEDDASAEEIRSAYRKTALRCHPDLHPDRSEAEEEFKNAAEAYQVLSDDDLRADYDRRRRAAARVHVTRESPSEAPSMVDELEKSDLFYRLTVSFYEAMLGVNLTLSIPRYGRCEWCGGEGYSHSGPLLSCSFCGGTGQLTYLRGPWRLSTACPACHGLGLDPGEICPVCRGKKWRRGLRDIPLYIPAGSRDGQVIRLPGEGEPDSSGCAGDLYIVLKVRELGHERQSAFDFIQFARPPWFRR